MNIIYKVSKKEVVLAKNAIFIKQGENELFNKGYKKLVYKGSFYGKNNLGGFSYNYYRLTSKSELEFITVHISKDDKWIKIYLNVFQLDPSVSSLEELSGLNGYQWGIPPNSISEMQLRLDEYSVSPIIYLLFYPIHKLGFYITKWGYEVKVKKLGNLIEKDMRNIDHFVKRWHELHKPLFTTWEGEIVGLKTMTPHDRLVAANLLNWFNKARIDNKQWAKQILEWLKVDNATIKKMLE